MTNEPSDPSDELSDELSDEPSLWRHRDFVRLWSGQTASLLGTQVTLLALPLTALLVLNASAGQLGLLNALEYLPVIVVTLLAGVLADRRRRRPLLVTANLGRAVVLFAVPVAAWTGHLHLALLYAVAAVVGVFTAVFDVTYQAYLPTLIDRRSLVQGNSKLQSSQSIAQTAGQGLSGILVALLTAPVAVAVDAVSYLVSVATLLRIRRVEQVPNRGPRLNVRAEIAEGLRVTGTYPLLRVVMLQAAWFNLLWDVVLVVVPIYALRTLHLSTAGLGFVIGSGSIGAFAGSLAAGWAGRRWGAGPAMAAGMLLACSALLLLPVAGTGTGGGLAVLVLGYVLNGFGITLFNVHSVALRQSIVPPHLIGRVSATYRFAAFAVIPVGGLLGGQFAEHWGARTALLVAAAGLTLGAIAFFASRVVREAGVTTTRRDHVRQVVRLADAE